MEKLTMISDNMGYDLLTSQYSAEGRIYQVEYAANASKHSGTAIGMIGSNGIVLAVDNIRNSPLHESGSNLRTFTINKYIGAVVAGFLPDARNIVNEARAEANEFLNAYHSPAPLSLIKQMVGTYVHTYTLYSGIRPFGASLILGSYIPDGPQLYCIQPSGAVQGYFGCAIGKASSEAMKEMNNINFKNMSIVELVKHAAKVIYAVHDDETSFDLELSWCGKKTNGRHTFVPSNLLEEAEDYAREMIENEESSDSD